MCEREHQGYIDAHNHSLNNRLELLSSNVCGCFCCLVIFTPNYITKWLDVEDGYLGPTGRCPNCGQASVIGSASCYPITTEFLTVLERYWFAMAELVPNPDPEESERVDKLRGKLWGIH